MKPTESERKKAGVGTNKNTWDEMKYYDPFTPWTSARYDSDPPDPPESMFVEPVPGIKDVTKFRGE
jgi:hypothetical protein